MNPGINDRKIFQLTGYVKCLGQPGDSLEVTLEIQISFFEAKRKGFKYFSHKLYAV
jgi:hypothetical protein